MNLCPKHQHLEKNNPCPVCESYRQAASKGGRGTPKKKKRAAALEGWKKRRKALAKP